MDFTTRLGLNKPNPDPVTGDFVDVAKLNENADKIDAVISFTICTSTSRPAAPFSGQAILETDTGRTYVWGGSAWLPLLIGAKVQVDTSMGIGTAPDANDARRLTVLQSGTTGALSMVLLRQTGAASSSRALSTMGGTDTQDRFWLDFDGKMQWAPLGGGGDATFYRSAAGTLKTDGAFDIGGTLDVGGVGITGSENGISIAAGTGSTSSTTYVNMPGTSSFSFTKKRAGTRIRVDLSLSYFPNGTNTLSQLGVSVNGSDFTCIRHRHTAVEYETATGFAYISGVPAGAYTVQGRWLVLSGTGVPPTIQTDSATSWICLSAKEVA